MRQICVIKSIYRWGVDTVNPFYVPHSVTHWFSLEKKKQRAREKVGDGRKQQPANKNPLGGFQRMLFPFIFLTIHQIAKRKKKESENVKNEVNP